MDFDGTKNEPTYLENVLFLTGAFFISSVATATVTSITGFESSFGYGVGIGAFVAVFIGLLAFYNSSYLSD